MSDFVLDSSAVLALLQNEPGADTVMAALPGALMSTVNISEVISKLCERGMPAIQAREAVEAVGIEPIDFTLDDATMSGALRSATRHLGLSLGDRACLALAHRSKTTAMTADSAWAHLRDFDGAVRIIR